MSKRKFITIDFLIMLFITLLIEVGLYYYARSVDISTSGITITFVVNIYIMMSLLVMFRWNKLGILFNLITTIVYLLISLVIDPVKEYEFLEIIKTSIVYLSGVLFFGLNIFWFKKVKKEKITKSAGLTLLYVLSGFLLVTLGRTIAASIELVLDKETFNIIGIFLAHFSNELLNLVLALIAFLILRKQKDIMQDMNDYLLQLAKLQNMANKQ